MNSWAAQGSNEKKAMWVFLRYFWGFFSQFFMGKLNMWEIFSNFVGFSKYLNFASQTMPSQLMCSRATSSKSTPFRPRPSRRGPARLSKAKGSSKIFKTKFRDKVLYKPQYPAIKNTLPHLNLYRYCIPCHFLVHHSKDTPSLKVDYFLANCNLQLPNLNCNLSLDSTHSLI